jgi:hypothetical protein
MNVFTRDRGFFSSRTDLYAQIRVAWPEGGQFNREVIAVRTDHEAVEGIYEGDTIAVWGEVTGTITGRNAFGGRIRQAEIDADYLEALAR